MNGRIRLALALALFTLPVARAADGVAPSLVAGFPETSSDRIFELEEVRPGQRGVGYTVFDGPKPETFDAVVLGVMEDLLGPGEDVILARLEGERIEFTGVISGMSGSPVFIDGRLVGAVAYRFGSFAKEPIAGITPIRAMLQADRASDSAQAHRAAARRRPTLPVSRDGLKPEDLYGRNRAWIDLPAPEPLADGVSQIQNPLAVSGMSGPARAVLAERLRGQFGPLSAVTAGSGTVRSLTQNQGAEAGRVQAPPIAPGGPIAAMLMKGDMNVAAIGTVTFVDQDRVLGFGHPFVGFGQVGFPMATAAILNTLASEAGSYKQGSPALEVGAIHDDRLTAIAGRLGRAADMVPVTVWVESDGASMNQVQVQVVDEPTYLPVMAEAVVASALSGRIDLEVGGTVDLLARVQVSNRTVEISDRFAAPPPFPVSALAARTVASMTGLIARNDLEAPDFESIEVRVRTRPRVQQWNLEKLMVSAPVGRPGQVITGEVQVRDYRQRAHRLPFELTVPRWAQGKVHIVAGGGYELDRYLDRPVRPKTLDDLLGALAERRPQDRLYVALVMEDAGVVRRGERFEAAPSTLKSLLQTASEDPVAEFDTVLGPVLELESPAEVSGLRRVQLRIES